MVYGAGRIGSGNFQLDIQVTGGRTAGALKFNDTAGHVKLTARSMNLRSVEGQPGRRTAHFVGIADVTGRPVSFELWLRDFGEPGGGQDSFAIRWSDNGLISHEGILRGGNIRIMDGIK
jgi:hypothetical protein